MYKRDTVNGVSLARWQLGKGQQVWVAGSAEGPSRASQG